MLKIGQNREESILQKCTQWNNPYKGDIKNTARKNILTSQWMRTYALNLVSESIEGLHNAVCTYTHYAHNFTAPYDFLFVQV